MLLILRTVYLEENTTGENEPDQTVYGTGIIQNPDHYIDRAVVFDGAVAQAAT